MADAEEYPRSMPGRFLFGSQVRLDRNSVEDAFRDLITSILRWIDDVDDERALRLRKDWEAIVDAGADEKAFCCAAGCLGTDPYELSTWPSGLAGLIEEMTSEEVSNTLVTDLLTTADPETVVQTWPWVKQLQANLSLMRPANPLRAGMEWSMSGGQAGFAMAYRLRKALNLNPILSSSDQTCQDIARQMGLGNLQVNDYNHIPDPAIQAAVGWSGGSVPLVARPAAPNIRSQRFLEARGLFHAAYLCENGPRLVTRAHDWDQQASRGFAAELLAPRYLVAQRVRLDDSDECAIRELAEELEVSEQLIYWQARNAYLSGITVP
ncbi:MAG: hypothetical protein IT440_15025 [Phycisphaeraceae bacterium]|nr:hypothetical protein [Phycisphaeraceae bacterium]